jgi:hypothetical protein
MRQQERFNLELKVTVDGNYTYVAFAPPGAVEADAVWQVIRYDETDGVRGKFADGDDEFDNEAIDLTLLDYGD